MDLILYHGHCPDGFCAAYIASKKYPEAKLVPMDHGADHTEVLKECIHKDVLMVDFSLRTREENDTLAASTRSFRILDHHKTAQVVLEGAPYAVFDMKRSGAGITWDELFGKEEDIPGIITIPGQPRPWYVNFVEDRDLWNWALPNSREICAYLGTLELTKEVWDRLDGVPSKFATDLGSGALAHINHYVREAVKQAQTGLLQGYKTAVLNVPYLNCSEIGNELAKTHEVSLTWFERGDGIIQFSLRSIGAIDVSAVAKIFNGGGHRNAAGFQLPLEQGRETIDRILGRDLARIKYLTQEIELIEHNLKAKAELEQLRSAGGCVK
jgi:oligoribonuclease NrnB/cAMP/cGMP phosphodiesterase (DHH superfamily)